MGRVLNSCSVKPVARPNERTAPSRHLSEPQARQDGVMVAGELAVAREDHHLVGITLPGTADQNPSMRKVPFRAPWKLWNVLRSSLRRVPAAGSESLAKPPFGLVVREGDFNPTAAVPQQHQRVIVAERAAGRGQVRIGAIVDRHGL